MRYFLGTIVFSLSDQISTCKHFTGVGFRKVFRTELGHKYILVECSVIVLCLSIVSKLSLFINSCAINRIMIGMSTKRISVLTYAMFKKPFVKSTPGARFTKLFMTEVIHKT